jgi:hypothetical protein
MGCNPLIQFNPLMINTEEEKTGQKIAHPVHFSLLLDFVAPYWLSVLPP